PFLRCGGSDGGHHARQARPASISGRRGKVGRAAGALRGSGGRSRRRAGGQGGRDEVYCGLLCWTPRRGGAAPGRGRSGGAKSGGDRGRRRGSARPVARGALSTGSEFVVPFLVGRICNPSAAAGPDGLQLRPTRSVLQP